MATSSPTYAEAGVQTSSVQTHVFKTPTLPLARPLTQEAIVIEQPSDYSNTCIGREELKNLHLDLLKDYAEHYDIRIDNDTLLRSEIAATLCLKNEYIPILETHEVARQDGRVLLSRHSSSPGSQHTGKARLESADGPESQNYYFTGTRKGEYDPPPIPTTSSSDDANASPDEIDFASLTVAQISKLVPRLQSNYVGLHAAFQDAVTASHAANKRTQDMRAHLQREKVKMKMVFQALADAVGKSGVDGGDDGRTNGEGSKEGPGPETMPQDKGKGKEKERGHDTSSEDPERPRVPLEPNRSGKETGLAEALAKDTPKTLNSPPSQARMLRCLSKNVENFIGNAGHCYFICGFHDLAPRFDQHTHSSPAAPSSSGTNPTASALKHRHHHKSARKRPLDDDDSNDQQQPTTTTADPSNHDSSSASKSGPKPSRKRARLEHDEDTSSGSSTGTAGGSDPSRGTGKKGLPLRRTFAFANLGDPLVVDQEFSGPETLTSGDTSMRSTRTPLRRTYACHNLEDTAPWQGPTARPSSLRRTISCHDLNDPEEVAREFVLDVAPLARTLSCYNLEDLGEVSRALAVEGTRVPGMTIPEVPLRVPSTPSTEPPTLFDILWGPDVQRGAVMLQVVEWFESRRQTTGGDISEPIPPPPTPTRRRAREAEEEEEEEEENSVGRQKKKVKLQVQGSSKVPPTTDSEDTR